MLRSTDRYDSVNLDFVHLPPGKTPRYMISLPQVTSFFLGLPMRTHPVGGALGNSPPDGGSKPGGSTSYSLLFNQLVFCEHRTGDTLSRRQTPWPGGWDLSLCHRLLCRYKFLQTNSCLQGSSICCIPNSWCMIHLEFDKRCKKIMRIYELNKS